MRRVVSPSLLLTLFLASSATAQADGEPAAGGRNLDLRPGDHISLIGNTLPDRMQHDGWLETYLHSRFPNRQLVIRNLGFSGDELTVRLRSKDFGTPDEWLRHTKADVVFAFFGYNESFAGDRGLEKFRTDLDGFIKRTVQQQYNGKSAARLVLFSPIAHEDLPDRNLPSGRENNARLAKYTAAMADVARRNNVSFVDLFTPTQQLYAKAARPLTINGVHLNERGNEAVAQIIDRALFSQSPAPKRETARLDAIRRAVLDQNFYWFNRYRTVDGYSIYGGRADLRFVGGQTNRVVMQREMEILDQLTANRDPAIWAAAQGREFKGDLNKHAAFIPVQSNKPGPLAGGKHLFLDGEQAIQQMKPGKGLKINLFASEKEFPDLINPVQMTWDTKGRLWVATWPTYPHWKPGEPMNDKLLILEDTDGDGKADRCTPFVEDLHCITGFEFWNGGVLVAQAPDLLFLKDTDGDGKADVRRRVLSGIDSADTHHTANSFQLDPGGALYFQEGTFHHTQVETPWGPPVRCVNAGVFRYEPRAQKFEVYVSFGFANPHGHVFDRWGQDIVVDGTGAVPYHGTLFSGQTDFPQRHGRPPQVYKQKTRPCAGIEILSSRHFPEANQGNLLVANVIGFQGILQYRLVSKGASFEGIEAEPIVSSKDPNFRPADIKMGPDGAIYFSDWHNPIIGHMQHNLRDPNRDREHGRVYRVTYEGRPLLTPRKIASEPVAKLLDLLREPEDRVRYWTRIELGGRDTNEVIAAVGKWADALDRNDPDHEHHLTEALWLHQNHNVVNEDLLRRMLQARDFRARAAATRVLCYWRDRVKGPLGLLRTQINDPRPRVRLEAIRALSFFPLTPGGRGVGGEGADAAVGVAVELLAHPEDQYLRYTFNETLNTLERRLGGGSRLDRTNIAASLLRMLDQGKVPAERRPALLETVCRHGGGAELKAVWEQARSPLGYPQELRTRVLGWLADAAIARRARPAVEAGSVRKLLTDVRGDAALLPEAIELAAAWKAKEAAGELRAIARDPKTALKARHAAVDALATLADPQSRRTLDDLAAQGAPLAVRFRAAAALARLDLDAGATAAAAALAQARDRDDPSSLVEAFLTRKGGPEKLAAALAKARPPADAAKRVLRAMYLAGRNDPPLANVVSKLAGLEAALKPPTQEEVRRLMVEATAKGDPARGERVFHRAELGCLKCHAVNKAGGHIGPDLGPLGGSSPLDYVITSILDPNASIKEEYLTKIITTASGQVITGVVAARDRNQVTLKDATGKLVRIPKADIETEGNGKSLMPEGVTGILTRAELLDLIAFVGSLGKPGGPNAASPAEAVRRWVRLREVPAVLKDVPNRDVLRDHLLRAAPEAWETVYGRVDGALPLDDLGRPGDGPIYLQSEVQVAEGGPVAIAVSGKVPVTLWVDEEPFEKQRRTVVQLTPGRHLLTLRLEPGAARTGALRIDLTRPGGSRVRFEVVQGE
ncbi:MAG: c-type cytochrome [Gemmataceae bacterium]|nr:c-type cytochrome [Gemmataceae bacterium]